MATAPEFGKNAQAQQNVPAEIQDFLEAHVANISAGVSAVMTADQLDVALRRMGVISDINGTMDVLENPAGSSVRYALDAFFCDLHDRGIAVKIMSGIAEHDNIYRFEIANRLSPEQGPLERQSWFHAKPVSLKDMRPGMIFDDEDSIVSLGRLLRVTAVDPVEFCDFLEVWHEMAPAQKDQALQPWLGLSQRLLAMKAAFAVSHPDPTGGIA